MHLCASCSRHVREALCPFCGTEGIVPTPVALSFAGLSRAQWLAGAALAGAALAACAPSHALIYGAPPSLEPLPDAGATEPATTDPGATDITPEANDAGLTRTPVLPPPAVVPMYGMPPR